MFYIGTVGEGQSSHHRSSYFGSITALSISASPIYVDIILQVGSKGNSVVRGIYEITKHPYFMNLVELISLTLFPLIPRGESLRIFSSETTKSLIFWSSFLGLRSIGVNMNQFSTKIFRVEGEI